MHRHHPDLRYVPSLVPEHRRNETAAVIEVEEYYRISKNREKVDAGTLDPDQDDGRLLPFNTIYLFILNCTS